jgi:hypothetical protein
MQLGFYSNYRVTDTLESGSILIYSVTPGFINILRGLDAIMIKGWLKVAGEV